MPEVAVIGDDASVVIAPGFVQVAIRIVLSDYEIKDVFDLIEKKGKVY